MSHTVNLRARAVAILAAVVAASAASLLLPGAASAASRADCLGRANATYQQLLECVTLDGVRAHQAAFQAIADANEGNRFSGFEGYDASVAYVVETLEAAGYDVEILPFDYLAYEVVGPSA